MPVQFNLPIKNTIDTYPATQGNEITKEYYNFLIGEINRGTIFRAVCRVENKPFGSVSYHLISVR